jgi:benzoyl-CoA reductase subunit B
MAMRIPEIDDPLRTESHILVDRWYRDLVSGAGGGKVVYALTSGSIAELFRAFGFRIVLPQMNAIHCGIRNVAIGMIDQGEALGCCPDICGYMKNDIGLMVGPAAGEGPFGRIPPPDLLVITNGGCFTSVKWFEALARYFDCPVHIVDIPFVREEELGRCDKAYVRGQIEELIGVCERVSGAKLDIDRLRGILDLSKEALELWIRLMSYGKRRPSPFDGFFEAVSYMAPLTILRGTRECVDYYRLAVDEVERRVAEKQSPVGKERFRLLFDGAPPWPRIWEFREMFRRWGGVGTVGTYASFVCACDYDRDMLETEDPLDFLSALAASSYVNWNLGKRRQYMERLVDEYQVDGIVVHSVKSCRPFSIGQLDIRNYFSRDRGIPSLFLDSDVIDPRFFSSASIMSRIDTFFEILSRNRPHSGGNQS